LKNIYKTHLIAGAGACNPEVVKFVVEEGNERVRELMNGELNLIKKEKNWIWLKKLDILKKELYITKTKQGNTFKKL